MSIITTAPAKPTTSQPTVDQENLSATLTVAVPAARVFAVLADPTTHPAIDGTGWVQESADRAPLTEMGQIFRMDMYHADHPAGDYQVVNKVEIFDLPHAIGWRTGRRRATVTWSSAAGSGVTTWRRSVRPRRGHAHLRLVGGATIHPRPRHTVPAVRP